MNFPKTAKNERGQAMVEMLLAISLLLLFAAGTVQLAIMFSAKTSFEQACGQAARRYAAGTEQTNDLNQAVWTALGANQKFFDQNTLKVTSASTSSLVAQNFLDNSSFLGPFISKAKSFLLDYSGQKWVVTINYKAAPILSTLFDKGIPFTTELAVLKYPGQTQP